MTKSAIWPLMLVLSVCGLSFYLFSCLPDIRAALQSRVLEMEFAKPPNKEIGRHKQARKIENESNPRRESTQQQLIGLKIVRKLPQTQSEILLAHRNSANDACQPVAIGEPIEITSFTPFLPGHSSPSAELIRSIPSSRRHILSIGFDMLDSDRQSLPTISGNQILNYLDEHYVSIQVVVQKDSLDGILYLHHRPMATVASYRKSALSQDLTPGIATSLAEYRSLGLFVRPGDVPDSENLRTLVLVHKSQHQPLSLAGARALKAEYEFVFVRARATEVKGLILNTFVTRDTRRSIHYLKSCKAPWSASRCSITTDLAISEYDATGLVPVSSTTRGSRMNAIESFSMSDLNGFARKQRWEGGAFAHLSKTLDAIIDGRFHSSKPVRPDATKKATRQ